MTSLAWTRSIPNQPSGETFFTGGNLRESLSKKSKTFSKMFSTIELEPELFLYYNNGVTIITEKFDLREHDDALVLRNFSVINGAQTTSTLGAFLLRAEEDNDQIAIDKLKRVLVLTKIYEVSPDTPNHKVVSERIRIYSNTQTPLSSRDMVSINEEQKRLQQRFLNGVPQIFINIKSGEGLPEPSKIEPHARISNEALAQLGLCAYFFDPNTVLSKKAQLFEPVGSADDGLLLNPTYDSLFQQERGIFFQKTSWEIDELLFIKRLHDDTRLKQKKVLTEQISHLSQAVLEDGLTPAQRDEDRLSIRRSMEIAQKCLFFNVAAYYKLRARFDPYCDGIKTVAFDTKAYYRDKAFKEDLILEFSNLIFSRTVQVIQDNSENENVYTWLRREQNQELFFSKLTESFTRDLGLAESYRKFVRRFKKPIA
jgi:hypothetical protein